MPEDWIWKLDSGIYLFIHLLKCEYCPHSVAVSQSNTEPRTALLTWPVVQKKMPWSIVLLLGGGFALAKGSEVKCTEFYRIHPVTLENKDFATGSKTCAIYKARQTEGMPIRGSYNLFDKVFLKSVSVFRVFSHLPHLKHLFRNLVRFLAWFGSFRHTLHSDPSRHNHVRLQTDSGVVRKQSN